MNALEEARRSQGLSKGPRAAVLRCLSPAVICTALLFLTAPPTLRSAEEDSALTARIDAVSYQAGSQWLIQPYRPNYILPVTYSFDPNDQPLRDQGNTDGEFDNVEAKFQISFLLPLWEAALPGGGDLVAAYTQVAFWNSYNSDLSEPFRDTNYEPEIFALYDTDFDVFGMRNRALRVGFVHQSNGRGTDVLTRSWNRVYMNAMLERGNFILTVKPWLILDDEENPDIDEYIGYGEIRAFYKHKDIVLSAMVRNNLRSSDNRGAVELGASLPVYRQFKGYVQFFSGYGESLLDYNISNERLGIGLMLTDWL